MERQALVHCAAHRPRVLRPTAPEPREIVQAVGPGNRGQGAETAGPANDERGPKRGTADRPNVIGATAPQAIQPEGIGDDLWTGPYGPIRMNHEPVGIIITHRPDVVRPASPNSHEEPSVHD